MEFCLMQGAFLPWLNSDTGIEKFIKPGDH